MRMSQASAMAMPAPAAAPGRAAIVGLRTETSAPVKRRCLSCRSAILSASDISSRFLSRWAPMPLTLPPEQNAVPAPVIMIAPTSGFSPQVLIMVRSAGVSSSESELRASGLFRVMTATRSRITQSSSLVPVSTVISVLMVSPFSLLLSEFFDPRPQLELPGPGAAWLLQYVPVAFRNGVGIEEGIRAIVRLAAHRAADAAVDDEMTDMNT